MRTTKHIWGRGCVAVYLLTVICYLLSACANKLTPQGGPVDSLPPMAVRATPENGVRHFAGRRVFIEFNEYVVLKDQTKEFFTSPLMKSKPTLSIRGRGVRVDIKDTLAAGQTYSLNFGNSIVDNHEGNPLAGFRYVFSTGSALDSMLTTGYTADAARGDSISKAFVFFYDARPENNFIGPDSTLLVRPPQVVGRAQNNGIFIAQNLKDIDYKVYAFEDKNSNQRYDPGLDKVGFLDDPVNPAKLEPIAIWLDPYRHYPTADPQTYMRLFSEPPARRQNLSASERTERNRVELRFAAPWPRIDTLTFAGVQPDSIFREYVTPRHDTMALWLRASPAALADTLKGRIVYAKTDSLGNPITEGRDLRLVWRKAETREEQRAREREEKERARAAERGEEYSGEPKQNPFSFKVDASARVEPERSIPIEFGMALAAVDSTRISLAATPAEVKLGDAKPVYTPVPWRIERDSLNIRRYTVRAEWDEARKYRLVIHAGAFENVAGERNDSLGAEFSIVPRSDFATLVMTVRGKSPEARYIVQLLAPEGNNVLREMPAVASGKYTLYYIPEGGVRLRVTEDVNANGRWDSGNLLERRQPERTEMYLGVAGDGLIPTRKNWEVDVELDMAALFAPVSIEKVRADLQRAEDARVAGWLEERAKAEEERRRKGSSGTGSTSGGMGIGSAMGGMKNQIQSTTR